MNRFPLLVLVAVLILTGCVSTRQHTVDLSDPYADFGLSTKLGPYAKIQAQNLSRQNVSLTEINRRARHREAQVVLMDARQVSARSLHVTPDSTSWFDAETGLFEHVATRAVQQIRFVKPSQGAPGWFLVGATIGAAVGAAIGYASGDTPPSECCLFCDPIQLCWSAGEKAAIGAVTLGSLGGIVGASMGRGKYIYHFEAPAPVPPVVTEDVKHQRPKRP